MWPGWITAFILAVASPPGGEDAVRLEIEGTLPFGEETLRAAVRLRVRVSTSAADLVTVREEAGQVEVTYRSRVRYLDLGRSTAAGAARRVALAVEDLLRAPVTVQLMPLPEPSPPPLPATQPPPPVTARTPAPRPSPPSEPELWRLGLFLAPGLGALEGRPRFAAELDGSLALIGPLRLALSAGGAVALPVERAGVLVGYAAVVAKAGFGIRFPEAAWEVRALGVVEPYFVSGGEGDQDVLPGAEVSFRYGFPLGALDLVGGVAVTGYFKRFQFEVTGTPALTTDQVLVTILFGLSYGSDG